MPALAPLGSLPAAVLAVSLALLAGWSLGGIFSHWRTTDDDLGGAVVRLAAGLNLVALLGMLVGLTGALTGSGSLLLMIASCSSLARGSERRQLGVLVGHGVVWLTSPSRWPAGTWCVVGWVLITLGPALCPPAGWDELVYHQVLPQRWLRDGWPHVYPDLPYSGFPSLAETLFWLMAPLDFAIAPRLLGWCCWLLAWRLLARGLRSRMPSGQVSIWVSAAALSPVALLISANCYVESWLLMNAAAFWLSTERAASPPTARLLTLWGVLAGGAAAIKLTGAVFLALPALWLVLKQRPRRVGWQAAALTSLVGVGFALPFYLRPWVLTGNPCFPFFARWFTGDGNLVAMSDYHHAIGAEPFAADAAWWSLPWRLAFADVGHDGSFGAQWLAVEIAIAVAVLQALRHRDGCVVWPVVAGSVLIAAWSATSQQARFAVPMLPWAIGLAATEVALWRPVWRRLVMSGVLLATVVSLPVKTASYYGASWETVCGLVAPERYVAEGVGASYADVMRAVREQTPPTARVLLLFEHRSFYVPRRVEIGTPYFQAARLMPPERFASAGAVIDALRSEVFTHVLAATSPLGPDKRPEWWERLTPVLAGITAAEREGRLTVVYESADHVLYAVAP